MIMFWNRKEVYIANTLNKFNEVRDRLSAKGIDYTYRVENSIPYRSNRNCIRHYMDYAYTYYLYVHKYTMISPAR